MNVKTSELNPAKVSFTKSFEIYSLIILRLFDLLVKFYTLLPLIFGPL